MYKLCKTPAAARRQRQIMDCLLALLCGQAFGEISVTALCQAAGIPRKTFYRYFDSKEDVLGAVIDGLLRDWVAGVRPARTGRPPEAQVQELLLFWKEHAAFLTALQRSRMSGMLIERAMSLACAQAPEGAAGEAQRTKLLFVICGLFGLILDWHRRGCRPDTAAMAQDAAALLTQPLFRPGP